MQVRHQLEPEGDFGGPVVVSDTGLEADVEVQLLFRGVLRPGHLFKTVRFCVDELGILRNWLIGITGKSKETVSCLFTSFLFFLFFFFGMTFLSLCLSHVLLDKYLQYTRIY